MPRTLSWLPRIAKIRDSVNSSVRSHYTRDDLQQLFQLQPRAAGKLLAMLPRTTIAGAHTVTREDLAKFLDQVRESGSVPDLMDEIRRKRSAPSRRKPRALIRRDELPVSLAGLPASVKLSQGKVEVEFTTVEELLRALMFFAMAISEDEQLEEFRRRYEPPPDTSAADRDTADLKKLFDDLRKREALQDQQRTPKARTPTKPV